MENENKEILDGGLGDDKSLNDIATKHNVPIEQIKVELEKGVKVEAEHTEDPKVAAEIAKDHLTEDPLYYDKLAKMEANPVTPTPEAPKADPIINIEEIVAKAVNAAVQQMATKFAETMQEDKAKRDAELQAQKEKHDAEIQAKESQITELKRTASTGVPGQQVEVGSEQMQAEAKRREFEKAYRTGYR